MIEARRLEGGRDTGSCGRGWLVGFRMLAALAIPALVAGCSMAEIFGTEDLPPEVSDPAIIETPAGAEAAYRGLLAQFRYAFGGRSSSGPHIESSFVAITGLLADELQVPDTRYGDDHAMRVDRRSTAEGEENRVIDGAYSKLQRVRGQASQAIGLLTRFAPSDRQALTGHAYALQGYAEVFLADLFCSGIPLSTLDFDGDYTLRPGSRTEEVYAHALELFEKALELSGDSARFLNLVRVGRARTLLALGRFDEAAAVAALVPDGYRYDVGYTAGSTAAGVDDRNFARRSEPVTGAVWELTVADREGGNGQPYRTGGDPRTRVRVLGTNNAGTVIHHPEKYDPSGASPIVLASGVEARLVEAEVALRKGGDWLGILNALRTDGTFTTRPNPNDAAVMDTLWNPGSGGVAGLAPLADPGEETARVDLLFRERAYWLFLTGHRQGDLRRLIRQYGRAGHDVYPVGSRPNDHGQRYGDDVTLPVPLAERRANPQYGGCFSRSA